MKKTFTHSFLLSFSLFSFLVLFSNQAKAQTGCVASFTFQQVTNSLTLNFTDASTSPNGIISWAWDFGDGSTSTSQNPSHTYAHDGTYLICLTMHDAHGCSNTICHHITVNPLPQGCHASFTYHADVSGNLFFFTNTSSGTTNTTTYLWTFGDGSTSTDSNPHHTYIHTGHYTVCLFISDSATGCSAHFCLGLFSAHVDQNHHNQDSVHHSSGVDHHHTDGGEHHHSGDGDGDDHHSGGNHEPKGNQPFSGGKFPKYHLALIPLGSNLQMVSSGEKQDYILNYPNPFNSSTTIQYELNREEDVLIELFDLTGNKITLIKSGLETIGMHALVLNADNLSTGFYLIKLNVGGETFNQRISVVK